MGNKKIGRPTDNPKNTVLKIRLDDDTVEKLEDCRISLNVSKAEVLRRGVHKMHDDLKQK